MGERTLCLGLVLLPMLEQLAAWRDACPRGAMQLARLADCRFVRRDRFCDALSLCPLLQVVQHTWWLDQVPILDQAQEKLHDEEKKAAGSTSQVRPENLAETLRCRRLTPPSAQAGSWSSRDRTTRVTSNPWSISGGAREAGEQAQR